MQRSLLIVFLILFYFSFSFSQSVKKEIFVKFTDNEIKAYVVINESDCALAKSTYGFYEYFQLRTGLHRNYLLYLKKVNFHDLFFY